MSSKLFLVQICNKYSLNLGPIFSLRRIFLGMLFFRETACFFFSKKVEIFEVFIGFIYLHFLHSTIFSGNCRIDEYYYTLAHFTQTISLLTAETVPPIGVPLSAVLSKYSVTRVGSQRGELLNYSEREGWWGSVTL